MVGVVRAAPFRLLVRATGEPAAEEEELGGFDAVVDATGTYSDPNWLGMGGCPALGEAALRGAAQQAESGHGIYYHLPDLLGAERSRFGGEPSDGVLPGAPATPCPRWVACRAARRHGGGGGGRGPHCTRLHPAPPWNIARPTPPPRALPLLAVGAGAAASG
jgi:hypothetical protein